MNYPSFRPSERISRKQVSIYIDGGLYSMVRAKAHAQGIPIQEIIARAINLALAEHGIAETLKPLRLRVFRRVQRAAGKRKSQRASRDGKVALSGWYDKKEVDALAAHCTKLRVSTQALAQSGLRLWLDLTT